MQGPNISRFALLCGSLTQYINVWFRKVHITLQNLTTLESMDSGRVKVRLLFFCWTKFFSSSGTPLTHGPLSDVKTLTLSFCA